MIHLDKVLLNQIPRTESNMERKDVVAPGKTGCIMPKNASFFEEKLGGVDYMKNQFE